jgi:hypothetical protein
VRDKVFIGRRDAAGRYHECESEGRSE